MEGRAGRRSRCSTTDALVPARARERGAVGRERDATHEVLVHDRVRPQPPPRRGVPDAHRLVQAAARQAPSVRRERRRARPSSDAFPRGRRAVAAGEIPDGDRVVEAADGEQPRVGRRGRRPPSSRGSSGRGAAGSPRSSHRASAPGGRIRRWPRACRRARTPPSTRPRRAGARAHTRAPRSMSRRWTTPSSPPVASRRPSGEKATE